MKLMEVLEEILQDANLQHGLDLVIEEIEVQYSNNVEPKIDSVKVKLKKAPEVLELPAQVQ